MKELIGKEILVHSEGQSLRGKLIADYPDRIVIGSEKDGETFVSNIIKSKMSSFTIKEEKPLAELEKTGQLLCQVPLTILACHNKSINCAGVRFVSNKPENELKQEDFGLFMAPCPKRTKTCKCGSVGNISKIDSKTMVNMFAGLVIGEYPEESKEKGI